MNYTQQSFYKSKQWQAFRRVVIAENTAEDGYIYCAMCGKPILRKYDLIIDHIEELSDANVNDATISLNPANVRCLHFRCHNERHERFGFGSGGYKPKPKRVYIVYGSPCAGKTSYVHEIATENDIIADLDSIYQMISANDRYIKPERLKGAAFAVREALYDLIKFRSGKWQNAYIITGGARIGDRERLKARVGADDFIFVEATKDECLQRIGERGKEWADYINEWFNSFQPDAE